jgi:predicted nucleotidyltransferase
LAIQRYANYFFYLKPMNAALLTELFGGAGRYKALRCLFEYANRSFATRELATAAGIDPGNASRWLRRWADLGLLERHTERGQTLFQASKDPALTSLRLLLQQDSETAQVLRTQLETLNEVVDTALIFGSAACGETHADSDIDLLLIAPKLSKLSAQAHFKAAGRKLGRPVNVQVFTAQAWQAALESGDTFVHDVVAKPVVTLKRGPASKSEERSK